MTNDGKGIYTRSGAFMSFDNPDPAQVRGGDIAHALSMTCRFAGQCRFFYSVARHCLSMVAVLEEWYGRRALGPVDETGLQQVLRWALLDDAAEAYTGDIPTPLKQMLGDMTLIEDRVMSAIVSRFGLYGPPPPRLIAEVDEWLLWQEWDVLMPKGTTPNDGTRPGGPWRSDLLVWQRSYDQDREDFVRCAMRLGLKERSVSKPPKPRPGDPLHVHHSADYHLRGKAT